MPFSSTSIFRGRQWCTLVGSRIYYIRNKSARRKDDLGFKEYIGSTIKDDWEEVRRGWLQEGKHYSRSLQNAWNKYDEASFEFGTYERLLSEPTDVDLLFIEQEWLDFLKPWADDENGYNHSRVAGKPPGYTAWSSEAKESARQKISRLQTGRSKSDPHKQKLRESNARQMSDPQQIESRRQSAVEIVYICQCGHEYGRSSFNLRTLRYRQTRCYICGRVFDVSIYSG